MRSVHCSSIHVLDSQANPIISTPKHTLIHIVRFNLIFLSTVRVSLLRRSLMSVLQTDREVPPLLVFETQHQIVDILCDYFGGKLSETIIRENFSTVLQVHNLLLLAHA